MKRGSTTKKNSRPIMVWIPDVLVPVIDRAVHNHDTDRSKYIRQAIREKLEREGTPQYGTHEEQ